VTPAGPAKHGGARPGAGRKPKALKYAVEIESAEAQILKALPSVLDGLIMSAKMGDVGAAKYLIDRVLGRVAPQAASLADDRELPMSEEDFEQAEQNRAWEPCLSSPL
jgi:gamma-glutamyl:cysteine ligase YbdK (ATP-grasp superfamily)